MHPALERIREITLGTSFETDLFLVGGAVRDELLGRPHSSDFDLVTRGSSADLARLIYGSGASPFAPAIFARFGTAMVTVEGFQIELVTARKESYSEDSRKPQVTAATYEEDAARRDFTVNTLCRSVHSRELFDPLNLGLNDLKSKILRTPLDPAATFFDDPLRMLRAVRFRWKLGFEPAEGLFDAIRASAFRLEIVSAERIRDELDKILSHPTAPSAFQDLLELDLLPRFAPEFSALVGVHQGKFHHLDAWEHTLLVLKNAGCGDLALSWSALLHDISKPETRTVDEQGNIRFFTHEVKGADRAREILRRLRYSEGFVETVAKLVKNHMRLGTAESWSPSASRRLIRDMGENLDRLFELVNADANALRPGVRVMDIDALRAQVAKTAAITPPNTLESPLSGAEIMELLDIEPGPKVGQVKAWLLEKVLDGTLLPDDKDSARALTLSGFAFSL